MAPHSGTYANGLGAGNYRDRQGITGFADAIPVRNGHCVKTGTVVPSLELSLGGK